jgi:hypothetical protein
MPSRPATPDAVERDQDPDGLLAAEAESEAEEAELADQEAQLDAAAEELAESGVAHKIATGDRETMIASAPAAKAIPRDRTRGAAAAPIVARRTETLPYVDDRVSKVWVALIALAFAAVFAYGFLGGKAGFLTRTPSPSPSPSATASPSHPASASPSASASGSPRSSPSP